MSKNIFEDENLNKYHNDTIQRNAHQDHQVMLQAIRILRELQRSSSKIKSTRYNISSVNLQRKIKNFMEIFSNYYDKFLTEKNNRKLPDLETHETQNENFIHELVKFQENLDACGFRHQDTVLSGAIIELKNKINKFIPVYSKYAAIMGTGPVQKPHNHPQSSELEH